MSPYCITVSFRNAWGLLLLVPAEGGTKGEAGGKEAVADEGGVVAAEFTAEGADATGNGETLGLLIGLAAAPA